MSVTITDNLTITPEDNTVTAYGVTIPVLPVENDTTDEDGTTGEDAAAAVFEVRTGIHQALNAESGFVEVGSLSFIVSGGNFRLEVFDGGHYYEDDDDVIFDETIYVADVEKILDAYDEYISEVTK